MELYLYTPAGLIGIADELTSVRWRRKFFEPGEIEIHLAATAENLALFAIGNIVRRLNHAEAAIIEGHEIDGEDFGVFGRMLSSVLDRTTVAKAYNFGTTYEAAMLGLLAEAKRATPAVVPGVPSGFPEAVRAQVTWKNLLTAEEKLAKASGIGFLLAFEPGVWTFQTYRGVDRSIGQTISPFVFFSDEFGNLTDPKYTCSLRGFKNFAYVCGEGEGAGRRIVTVDRTNGGERRELFVDAKEISSVGLTAAEYVAALTEKGTEALNGCLTAKSFEACGENVSNFIYRQDWDLGDLVTVQYAKLGITLNERITEVEEIYEFGVETITPTFGTPLPETLDMEVN